LENEEPKCLILPYGSGNLQYSVEHLQGRYHVFQPNDELKKVADENRAVKQALTHPVGIENLQGRVDERTSVAITVNDKTRPVPNSVLLPPLLSMLRAYGVKKENISLYIASGTHFPMTEDEYPLVLSEDIIRQYRITSHNCDDNDNLYALGYTSRNTPVFVNREFFNTDLKIIVGDIELHHFAGYSGGAKSAAIGLAGRATINANHKLLIDDKSTIGCYQQNPLRQDIEEIGSLMKIDLALNAVLNKDKEILGVFFGKPGAVMEAGICLVDKVSRIHLNHLYDVVIASAGGYPKDINLYQAQKAMTHASFFCKPGGAIILIAECVEGIGSNGYLEFMSGIDNISEVFERFKRSDFMVGPHKAFLVARILQQFRVFLYSSLSSSLVESLLLKPINSLQEILNLVEQLSFGAEVAILPHATACIATLDNERHD